MSAYLTIRHWVLAGVIVSLLLVASAEVGATCTAAAVQNNVSLSTSFDPFAQTLVRISGTASVKNSDTSNPCTGIYLTFQSVIASLSSVIPFDITTASGNTQLIGDTTGILVGDMATGGTAGDTVSVNFDFVIPALGGSATAPASGTYSATITLVLLDAPNGTQLDNSKTLLVSANISDLVDININEASYIPSTSLDAYTMTFGSSLTNGLSASVPVTTRSNGPYHMTITSDNSGVMKNTDTGITAHNTVPYTASFGGSNLNLSSTATLSSLPNTLVNGNATAFQVNIGDTSNARAGDYKDVITLTVGLGP